LNHGALKEFKMHTKNTLIHFYNTAWPAQEILLHELLRACEDEQTIIQFKKYIEKYAHPHRYSHINLTPAFYYLPGSKFVYTSAEFKRLSSVVSACLKNFGKSHEMNVMDSLISLVCSFPCEGVFFMIFLMLITRVAGNKQENNASLDKGNNQFFHRYKKYQSIPMQDIRHKKIDCERKMVGASEGKICNIDGTTYYMKKIVPAAENENNKPVLGAYNHRFLRENIGIQVSPETDFLCMNENQRTNCYFSSKKVEHFLEAITLCRGKKKNWCDYDNHEIINKIGEKSVAELAVANTFIKDLHSMNWGYRTTIRNIGQNRLVILDTDNILERDLETHIEFVHKQFSKKRFGIPLRLIDVFYMKNIYLAMQRKPVLTFHKSVDMPPELYKVLLRIFIEACDRTLLAHTANGSANCDHCNSNFAKYVYEIGTQYIENNVNTEENSSAPQI